jgi:hypothetical protein
MINRPERLICFLVVWLTMFSCVNGWGQNPYQAMLKKDFSILQYPGTSGTQYGRNTIFLLKNEAGQLPKNEQEQSHPMAFFGLNPNSVGFIPQGDNIYAQPSNLYYLQSGFFCKREWEFAKTTHIPFRFRLGSLSDCNVMEGKH